MSVRVFKFLDIKLEQNITVFEGIALFGLQAVLGSQTSLSHDLG